MEDSRSQSSFPFPAARDSLSGLGERHSRRHILDQTNAINIAMHPRTLPDVWVWTVKTRSWHSPSVTKLKLQLYCPASLVPVCSWSADNLGLVCSVISPSPTESDTGSRKSTFLLWLLALSLSISLQANSSYMIFFREYGIFELPNSLGHPDHHALSFPPGARSN